MRDPCKKCIVKIMCSEECSERIKYYQYTEGMPHFYRIAGITLILSLVTISWGIIIWISKALT